MLVRHIHIVMEHAKYEDLERLRASTKDKSSCLRHRHGKFPLQAGPVCKILSYGDSSVLSTPTTSLKSRSSRT